ncbi:MAG: PAS domain-containing protein [Pseudomonadota bacterium]
MVSVSKGFAGLTQAQTDLVKHWHKCCHAGVLPTRECLDPGAIKAHLSAISMVEIPASGGARFRLAGSGLRQIFGREMRGRLLSELDRTMFEMWSLGLARALDMGQPIGGVIERGTNSHTWLRLPLRSEATGAIIICHDALVPNARLRAECDSLYIKKVNINHNIAA